MHRWAVAYGRAPHEILTLDPEQVAFDMMVLEAGRMEAAQRTEEALQGAIPAVLLATLP